MRRNLLACVVLFASTLPSLLVEAKATPPSDPTPGARIRRVDADLGVVVQRQLTRVDGTEREENVITHVATDREQRLLISTCTVGSDAPCELAKGAFEEETRREQAAAPGNHRAATSLLVADEASGKSGAKSIHDRVVETGDANRHVVVTTLLPPVNERASLRVLIDDNERYAVDIPWPRPTVASQGFKNVAWAQVYCGERNCLVIAGWSGGTDKKTIVMSKPIPLEAQPPPPR